TALSLFLLLGGYRNSISYGNLEGVAALINQQAMNEVAAGEVPDPASPPQDDVPPLLLRLRGFLNQRNEVGFVGETSVAVIDASGRVLLYSSNDDLDDAVVRDLNLADPSATDGGLRQCRLEIPGGNDLLCVSVPLKAELRDAFPDTQVAGLVVAEPAASLGEVFGDLMPRLAFSGLIGVAAALILGFVLSQSVAAPLRNIARAARSVARGNYRQRVPATGPREVRDLAANFNRMTEEVQRSQQTLRDFLANISHELKTPLTSIRGFSDAILDGTIDDSAGIERSARIINTESNRVLRLVEELLDLSRIESGQVLMRQEDVDLGELFEHLGEVFALREEETNVAFEVSPGAKAHIRGDFDRLEQVLNNLVDNAFRHTPAGGTVRLASRDVQPGIVQVTVSDTGGGIPAEDVPHLFERFYRSSNGNAHGRKGHGLGLAISREIVRAHGGDIWVTTEQGRGTAFVFTLPAVPQRRGAKAKAR
ncbi:MAG: HAMP domain-containing histidine kinase, partial [Dehalococcoidia bacterium]|nr:HAMP domain-containing histidine kinase [Dehalococcoidia bacterium]